MMLFIFCIIEDPVTVFSIAAFKEISMTALQLN
jgi:hypothetical protein